MFSAEILEGNKASPAAQTICVEETGLLFGVKIVFI